MDDIGYLEQYCEVCSNFDKDWVYENGQTVEGPNKNCGTCEYKLPSNFKEIIEEWRE